MRILLGLFFLHLSLCSNAFERIEVATSDEIIELPGKTWLYIDSSTALSLQHIVDLPRTNWEKVDIEGFYEHPGWIFIPLTNNYSYEIDRVLYLNNPFLHAADFYFVVNDCVDDHPKLTGLSRPTSSKPYKDPAYPVLLTLPAKSKIDVYIKVSDPFSTTDSPMFLLSPEKAKDLNIWRFQVGFLWLGIVLLSLLLSTFLFFYTKQKIFIYYVLLGLGSAIAISANIGVVLLFIESDPYQLLNNYYEFGAALLINFMPRFLNCIVPIAQLHKVLWKAIKGMGFLSFFVAGLYCIPYFKLSYLFSKFSIDFFVISSGLVFLYLLVLLGIAAFKRIEKATRLFIVYLIYLGLAFGVIIFPFVGINNKGLNTIYLMVAGSAFETVAFMLLMAQVTLGVYRERDRLGKLVQSNQENMMHAIVKSQEDERKRFSEDMHDGLGQMISSLNLNLKSLESVKSTQTEKRLDIFQTSRAIIEDMYAELKNICFNLMPHTLISAGVAEALRESAARINKSEKLYIEVLIHGLDERLLQVQETSIYRISQEWVNNIIKYADAKKITLQITKDDEEITLMIEDDGMGFDPSLLEVGNGNGWKNICSRANLIKATVFIDSESNKRGSTFILNIPSSTSRNISLKSSQLKDTILLKDV